MLTSRYSETTVNWYFISYAGSQLDDSIFIWKWQTQCYKKKLYQAKIPDPTWEQPLYKRQKAYPNVSKVLYII